MKRAALFLGSLCVLLSVTLAKKPPITTPMDLASSKSNTRIISGRPAESGQFPWQVAIRITKEDGTYLCGGSLIATNFILTAAHCVIGGTSFEVHLGSLVRPPTVDPDRVTVESTEAVYHKDYDRELLYNDIGLIRLPAPVQLNNRIAVIPLATFENYLPASEVVTAVGWGKTEDGEDAPASSVLNYVDLITIPNGECRSVYEEVVVVGTVCCRGRPQHSTCSGDSGGGLVKRNPVDDSYVHVAVVSFVHRDGCASGNPSGFVRTSTYREWIDYHMENFGEPDPTDPPQGTTPDAAASIHISHFLFAILACFLKRIAF